MALIPIFAAVEIPHAPQIDPQTTSLATALCAQTEKIHKCNAPGALQALVMTTTGQMEGCTPPYDIFHDHDGPWDIHHPDPQSTYKPILHCGQTHPDPFPASLETHAQNVTTFPHSLPRIFSHALVSIQISRLA